MNNYTDYIIQSSCNLQQETSICTPGPLWYNKNDSKNM